MNTEYHRLLVAPHSIRSGLVERIEREIEQTRRPRSAHPFKCNSIVDEKVIDALYRASQAGVEVDVLVRGICVTPWGSRAQRDDPVRSILGRFLEHSRVYEFANGGDTEVFIGSADMMHRNLDRRVETLVSITTEDHIDEDCQSPRPRLRRTNVVMAPRRRRDWHGVHTTANGSPLRDLQNYLIKLRQRPRSSTR